MNKTILHLEDEEPIRLILGEWLKVEGYLVNSVASAGEALAAVRAAAPDLIISDLQLAEADGLKTVAQLLEIRPGTPVILLTGVLIDPQVARETVGRLVTAYIEKTRPLSEIMATVTRLIGPAK